MKDVSPSFFCDCKEWKATMAELCEVYSVIMSVLLVPYALIYTNPAFRPCDVFVSYESPLYVIYINKPTRCTFVCIYSTIFVHSTCLERTYFVHHQKSSSYCICSFVQTMQMYVTAWSYRWGFQPWDRVVRHVCMANQLQSCLTEQLGTFAWPTSSNRA